MSSTRNDDEDLAMIRAAVSMGKKSSLHTLSLDEKLCIARCPESKEFTEELIMRGADVNYRLPNGRGPLTCTEDPDCIELLLRHKANIDAEDNRNLTPLMHAVRLGKVEAVECLLKHKASLQVEKNSVVIHDAIDIASKTLSTARSRFFGETMAIIIQKLEKAKAAQESKKASPESQPSSPRPG